MSFEFQPIVAADVLARMKAASDGPVALQGSDWQQAAMGALFNAELLAAQAGIVPFVTINGVQGIINIGAAREQILTANAPPGVREIYLACHGAVRRTHARMESASEHTPTLPGGLVQGMGTVHELGALPLVAVVIIIVVAVAAIVAAAWYARSKVETDGRNLRVTSEAATIAQMAHEQLVTTGKIDPGIYESLQALAAAEASANEMPWQVTAGLTAGALGLAGAIWWKLTHRTREATP